MENDTLTPTAEELIDEIGAAFVEHNDPPPNSFTLADFVALKNARSQTTAYRYLEDLVKMGKLKKTKVGKSNYYHKAEGA